MSQLVRIKYYENPIAANRDKQILQERGIKSWIANEQTIQSDWLLSQAIGGIQLQVFEEHFLLAKTILDEFHNNESYALEVEHTIENPEFDFVCPNCDSNHIYREDKPDGFFGLSLLFFMLPIKIPSNTYHCYYCNHEFKK